MKNTGMEGDGTRTERNQQRAAKDYVRSGTRYTTGRANSMARRVVVSRIRLSRIGEGELAGRGVIGSGLTWDKLALPLLFFNVPDYGFAILNILRFPELLVNVEGAQSPGFRVLKLALLRPNHNLLLHRATQLERVTRVIDVSVRIVQVALVER